jgi:hypothetical protein
MKVCYICEHKIMAEHIPEDDLRLEEDYNYFECTCTCHSIPNLVLR